MCAGFIAACPSRGLLTSGRSTDSEHGGTGIGRAPTPHLADTIGYREMLAISAAGFLIVSATLAASRFRTARID